MKSHNLKKKEESFALHVPEVLQKASETFSKCLFDKCTNRDFMCSLHARDLVLVVSIMQFFIGTD